MSSVRVVFGGLESRQRALAGAVLALAAFNLAFRLGNEMVQVWDESLYAITAQEIVLTGNWIGTTFLGALDYYNSKPPLNVWLIALSFKVFGVGLWSLRLPSVVAAWLTVAVLQWWARRCFGVGIAIVASLVLATSYGFLYVHSGRSANTDAVFTLLILLVVAVLWSAQARPWHRVWLGPLLAAVFMVKGMAIVMPLVIVVMVEAFTARPAQERWRPLLAAAAATIALVTPWIVARWLLDEGRFFERLFFQDLVARTATVLDGHEGSPFYYFYILQMNHYDWLAAAAAAMLLAPGLGAGLRRLRQLAASDRTTTVLMVAWLVGTLALPTLMATKLGWYLNSFYPLFAIGTAGLLVCAYRTLITRPRRAYALTAVVALAVVTAEARLAWHSYEKLDIRRSAQSLLLDRATEIRGHRVYANDWPYSDLFVVRAVSVEYGSVPDVSQFLLKSRIGDYWLGADAAAPELTAVASTGRQTLFRRDR